MLVVDLSASQRFGTRSAQQGASRRRGRGALRVQRDQAQRPRRADPLRRIKIEKIVPPKKGQKHVMRVVREILGAEPERTGTDLQVALETLFARRAAAQRGLRGQRLLRRAATSARCRSRGAARRDPGHARRSARRGAARRRARELRGFRDRRDGAWSTPSSARVRAHYAQRDARAARDARSSCSEARRSTTASCAPTSRTSTPLRDLFARRARRSAPMKPARRSRRCSRAALGARARVGAAVRLALARSGAASAPPPRQRRRRRRPDARHDAELRRARCPRARRDRSVVEERSRRAARAATRCALELVSRARQGRDGAAERLSASQAESAELEALENAGFVSAGPGRRRGPECSSARTAASARRRTVDISFVPLPKKPGRNVLVLPPLPISDRARERRA